MDLLLLISAGLSFVLGVYLLMVKAKKRLPDRILGVWLLFLSIDFIRSYILFIKGNLFLLGFGYTLPFLYGALLFIYVISLIEKKEKLEVRLLLHFIPFLLVNVYMFFFIYSKSSEWRSEFFEQTSFSSRPILFNIILLLDAVVIPAYIVWIYLKLKSSIKNIKNINSCSDHIHLFWVNYLLISIAVFWILGTYSKLINGYFNHLHYSNITMGIYFLELLMIMVIGYFGFKQGMFFIAALTHHENSTEDTKYKTSGLSSDKAGEFLPILKNYMKKEKPYLNNQLSISGLAKQINIPSNHLSQIINEKLNMNFFEFVNNYRVEEVKRRISKNQNTKFTLLAIAFDSGFNSKSSFNNIFKKQTGLTPREFMNRQILT